MLNAVEGEATAVRQGGEGIEDVIHITIPTVDLIRVGALAAIVAKVGKHFSLERRKVALRLFAQ